MCIWFGARHSLSLYNVRANSLVLSQNPGPSKCFVLCQKRLKFPNHMSEPHKCPFTASRGCVMTVLQRNALLGRSSTMARHPPQRPPRAQAGADPRHGRPGGHPPTMHVPAPWHQPHTSTYVRSIYIYVHFLLLLSMYGVRARWLCSTDCEMRLAINRIRSRATAQSALKAQPILALVVLLTCY